MRLHELLLSPWITHTYPSRPFASSLYSLHKSHLCASFSKKNNPTKQVALNLFKSLDFK